eukprot:353614-Chlamydomonas_euryale.AAC.1
MTPSLVLGFQGMTNPLSWCSKTRHLLTSTQGSCGAAVGQLWGSYPVGMLCDMSGAGMHACLPCFQFTPHF